MLRSALNPGSRRSTLITILRSLVVVASIFVALGWIVSAADTPDTGYHTPHHATNIGHSTHDECCTNGLDCKCSTVTGISASSEVGPLYSRAHWSRPARRNDVDTRADRLYHPPRPFLIT